MSALLLPFPKDWWWTIRLVSGTCGCMIYSWSILNALCYSPYSPLPSQPSLLYGHLYVWYYVDAFQVQISVPKWSYLNSHSLKYMWLELLLHYCGVHMLMSNVPDIQQASGFQYSKEPRQCLDLDIQLILRLLGFNIPESLVNAWTWIFNWHFIGNSNPIYSRTDASNFHICHWNLGRWLEKLTLEGSREGHEDAYDVSCWSAFFKNLSYFVGGNWRMFHIQLHALKLIIGS